MELRKLGKTGIKVTPVGMGVLTIGRSQLNLSIEEGAAVVRYALDSGINFLDTAQYYQTYSYIREALKNSNHNPVIASKCLDCTYKDMKYAVEECQNELERNNIDIFLLHEVREAPDLENRLGAWEYLKEAKSKGYVKAIGLSTHYVDITDKAADMDDLDVIFPLINYKSLGIRNGSGPGSCHDMAAVIHKASQAGKGIFAMKVFGGGNLTGNYIEALDYVADLPGVDSMMIGMGNNEDVDRAIQYAEGSIDRSYVPDIKNKRIRVDSGDCEGCGSCIKICPNKAIQLDKKGTAWVDHSICITCGYCAPSCPVRAIIMY